MKKIRPDLEIQNQSFYFSSSEKMNALKNESIDVIVTSPPYNRGKTYLSEHGKQYNDSLPESEYLSFLENVWRECYRVASNRCVFYLNIGDSARDQGKSEKVAKSAENAGWKRIQDIIWVKSLYGKGHYTPSGGKKRFNNIWEHVFLFVKKKSAYSLDPKAVGICYTDKTNIGRYSDVDKRDPGNVWHICYETTTGATRKKGHAAPFPIGLPYKCIKSVSYANTILDPFAGTGTTLIAAELLGKKGYGYEKYPNSTLIQNTFEREKDFQPREEILIPHYEVALQELMKLLLNQHDLHITHPKTKKGQINREILVDTFDKMDVSFAWKKWFDI